MMIDWTTIPKAKNIMVLANYRTGSTALCDIISLRLQLKNLDEFFESPVENVDVLKTGGKKIIKVMPDHVQNIDFDTWNWILNNFYCIGISRSSLVNQVVSYYIADVTSKWTQREYNWSTDPVDIDIEKLTDTAMYLQNLNVKLNQMSGLCAQWLIYEDVKHELSISRYKKHQSIENVIELKTVVEEILLRLSEPVKQQPNHS